MQIKPGTGIEHTSRLLATHYFYDLILAHKPSHQLEIDKLNQVHANKKKKKKQENQDRPERVRENEQNSLHWLIFIANTHKIGV